MKSQKLKDLYAAIDDVRLVATILMHEEKISKNTFDMIYDRTKKIEFNIPNGNDFFKELTELLTPYKTPSNVSNQIEEGFVGSIPNGDYHITIKKIK